MSELDAVLAGGVCEEEEFHQENVEQAESESASGFCLDPEVPEFVPQLGPADVVEPEKGEEELESFYIPNEIEVESADGFYLEESPLDPGAEYELPSEDVLYEEVQDSTQPVHEFPADTGYSHAHHVPPPPPPPEAYSYCHVPLVTPNIAQDGTCVGTHQLIQMSNAHLATARFVPRGKTPIHKMFVPLIPVNEATSNGFIYNPLTNPQPVTTTVDGRIQTNGGNNILFAPASTLVTLSDGVVTYSAVPNTVSFAGKPEPPRPPPFQGASAAPPQKTAPRPPSQRFPGPMSWPLTVEEESEPSVSVFIPNTPSIGGEGRLTPSLIPAIFPSTEFRWVPPGFSPN